MFLIIGIALMLTPRAGAQVAATLVGPGVISTSAHEGAFAITPDGGTIYFTRFVAGSAGPSFLVSQLLNGTWTTPRPVMMPEGASLASFSFSPDGTKLFYAHVPDASRMRLWVADRDGEGWKNARPVGAGREPWDGDQSSPSVTADGTLYFTSERPSGSGAWDIYRSVLRNGLYTDPELLGGGRYRLISTPNLETGVTVAPNGKFIVFSDARATNGFGGSDLQYAELPENGQAFAINLGPLVNTVANETDPQLSADGKRLYFCRSGDIYQIDLKTTLQPPVGSAVWERRASMPNPRSWPQTAVAAGRIYVYGGLDPRGQFVSAIDVYDPVADSWFTFPSPPKDWKQGTLVVVDERLFLFRRGGPGVAEYRPESKHWEIKVASNKFAIGEGFPTESRTVVLGRKAYTMSHVHVMGYTDYTYFVEYDFDTGVWTSKRSMPFPAPILAFGGKVYAFDQRVSIYDPSADEWRDLGPTDTRRMESALAVVGDEMWVIGGHGTRAEACEADLWPSVMRFDVLRNEWRAGPPLPWQRATASAAVVNGRLFVIGGTKVEAGFLEAGLASDTSVLEYVPGK